MISKLTAALALATPALAATAEEWKNRAVYQVLTDRCNQVARVPCDDLTKNCGGNWKGVTSLLDHIASMGFTAIQISPIYKQYDDYMGYSTLDFTQLNDSFGTEADLKELINSAHAKGLYVMVDFVPNQVANVPEDSQATIVPFGNPKDHPENYHEECPMDNWDDQEVVQNCRFQGHPDLDQDNSFVHDTLVDQIKNAVSTFGIDGVRVGLTNLVGKDFLKDYAEAAGVFTMGSVYNSDYVYDSGYQSPEGPLDSVLNYPSFYAMTDVFKSQSSMWTLHSNRDTVDNTFSDPTLLGMFLDDYNNARFLSSSASDFQLFNALTYQFSMEGIPIFYYGTEWAFSGDYVPENREAIYPTYDPSMVGLYEDFISKVNKARSDFDLNHLPFEEKFVDSNYYGFMRGDYFVGVTNVDQDFSVRIEDFAEPGTTMTGVLNGGEFTVADDGSATINVTGGKPEIYAPANSGFLTK